ncbi:MAG: YHS domain-containing protein [Candidatus Aminicenantes bacterium]|nr:YHS domain-containing protein [Candidatus Aminicenantes bacterium]
MFISFFRIIFYALLIYVILKLFRLFQKPASSQKNQVENKVKTQGIMVKDEVCDVYLPKDEALKTIFQGKEYYFCSEKCKQKFLESHIKH